jgi:hypothetical protein
MGRWKASRDITTENRSQKRLQQIFTDLTTLYPPAHPDRGNQVSPLNGWR